jgi:hypothetical protein
MRSVAFLIAWLFLASSAGTAQAAGRPVVVELYTSQGCSSCVAADTLLADLADKPGVLALTMAVGYWDYLGWPDTFAKPEFAERQRVYLRRASVREAYTPQIVIDGRYQEAAVDPDKIARLVRRAEAQKSRSPIMRFVRSSHVRIGPGRVSRAGADIWLVRYDPADQEVTVRRGENRGQTLVQKNVVRQLVRLGAWRGRDATYPIPDAPKGAEALETCILLQASGGGRILGVLQR